MILKINYTLIPIQVLLTKPGIFREFFRWVKEKIKSLIKPAFFCTHKTVGIVLKYLYRFYVNPEIPLPFSSQSCCVLPGPMFKSIEFTVRIKVIISSLSTRLSMNVGSTLHFRYSSPFQKAISICRSTCTGGVS